MYFSTEDPMSFTNDAPEYVLAFFPTYLTGEDGNDAWDLRDGRAWDAGRAGAGGGPDSCGGQRDDDPGHLAAWVAGRLGYPVTLTSETYKIGHANDTAAFNRGEPVPWRTEPLYRVRPVDRAQAAEVERARDEPQTRPTVLLDEIHPVLSGTDFQNRVDQLARESRKTHPSTPPR